MITNPINGKSYCLSKCAKDKFQTCIIDPLLLVVVVVAMLATAVAFTWAFGIMSIAVQMLVTGDLVFYDVSTGPLENITLHGLLSILLVFTSITIIKMLEGMFKSLNRKLDHWVNTPYEQRIKSKCTLLEECTKPTT